MTKDAKQRFLIKLEQMTEELYRLGDSTSHNEAWDLKRSFVWGYGDAGKTISLVTAEEIQMAIDRAHERIYGESRINRRQRLKPLRSESNEIDWDIFDSPSYERKEAE